MSTETGVIHDIGYQRYDGPRLGRAYAARSLYVHGLRTAFGFGRSAKAKIFPWFVVAVALGIAVIVTAVRAIQGEPVLGYLAYTDSVSILVVLFCAIIGPELVSRDLRTGVLPLYFSRPLTRRDYALAKLAAVVSAAWLVLAAPLTLMFLGGLFSAPGGKAIWQEAGHYAAGLGYAAVCAALFGSLATLVGSLSGRRAVAAAIIAAYFLVTSAVAGAVIGIGAGTGNEKIQHAGGLLSPDLMIQGVRGWLFRRGPGDWQALPVGGLGLAYTLLTAAFIAACVLLTLLRYRKVAR
ncbi:ABC transporter permease subunit [Hamadaea tsunoensis]|uniref:ABC transporter permease subunit n=1 Tax=Hamadaea tsunoensis TaxID=53368 RepID=UPI0003FF8F2A|nr:ABC transporter permease subunit [Hamadaea tsunoensis]